jgi:hypothetical protein
VLALVNPDEAETPELLCGSGFQHSDHTLPQGVAEPVRASSLG